MSRPTGGGEPVVAPAAVAETERIQDQLRQRLDLHDALSTPPRLVAGVDVSYDTSSPRVTAAAVVFDLATAHPRRFGLACHLGVVTGLPTAPPWTRRPR